MGPSFLIIGSRFKHTKHHSLKVYRATNADICEICGFKELLSVCVQIQTDAAYIFDAEKLRDCYSLIVPFTIFIYTYIVLTGFPHSSSVCNEM